MGDGKECLTGRNVLETVEGVALPAVGGSVDDVMPGRPQAGATWPCPVPEFGVSHVQGICRFYWPMFQPTSITLTQSTLPTLVNETDHHSGFGTTLNLSELEREGRGLL